MKIPNRISVTPVLGLLLSTLVMGNSPLLAQGNSFTYQGRLNDSNGLYTGNAEFQPTLWDAASSGSKVADNSPAQVVVAVTNGLFTLPLDFGANFPGADRWLQLEVRTAIGPFTTLTPRQQFTPTPYALYTPNAGTAATASSVPAGNLTGTISDARLSANVSLLGPSIESAEITSLDAGKIGSGTLSNARLSANVSLLGQSVESAEITDGTIATADIGQIDASKIVGGDLLAARLKHLAADRALLIRLSLNALQRYRQQPKWEQTAGEIRQFLLEMIKNSEK